MNNPVRTDGGTHKSGKFVTITILGITQIFAWGSSYYLPAVIAGPIAQETQWPLTWVVAGLSLGLLVAALVSPTMGKQVERHGGRSVLALSTIALGAGQLGLVLSLSFSASITGYMAAWAVMGLGMGLGLYDTAFATLGRLYGKSGRSAIAQLTLFGGFASTLCWPLSAFLVSELGWRGACMFYAAFQFGVALPLYLFFLPSRPVTPGFYDQEIKPELRGIKPEKSSRTLLVLLVCSLTLAASISSMLSVHLLTILQAGGITLAGAVTLGALVGPSQVGARAVEIGIARYHHPVWTKMAAVTFLALGLILLWSNLHLAALALVFYGAGIGLQSIARGTLPLALYGADGYAALMGRLALPSLFAQAFTPWAGAILLEYAGASWTIAALVVAAMLNLLLAICLLGLVLKHQNTR